MSWLHAPEVSATVRTERGTGASLLGCETNCSEVGIAAEVVRLTPPRSPTTCRHCRADFTVLAYAVDDRGDLYGLDFILDLARRRPDIPFLLLAATPNDALPANVKPSVG